MDPLRVAGPVGVGVIGCGNFARRQHLPNLAALPAARLVGVCDIDAAVAAQCASEFGAGYGTADADRLCADPAIGAVVVAVRDDQQAVVALRVLEAGKALYVEKPAAQSPAEFRRLIAARDRAGVPAAVGFNKRFAPAYIRAAEHLAAAGGTRMLLLRMADDAWRWAKGYPPGELLRHDLCHLFDLVAWLTRSRVRSVRCASPRPEDDALLLESDNGAVATIFGSGNVSMDFPKERMEAIADRGAVTMEDFVEVRTFGIDGVPAQQTFAGRASRTEDVSWVERIGMRGIEGMIEVRRALWEAWRASSDRPPSVIPNFLRDQGWVASLDAFVDALSRRVPLPHASLEDARAAAAVADAAERSRASGRMESVERVELG